MNILEKCFLLDRMAGKSVQLSYASTHPLTAHPQTAYGGHRKAGDYGNVAASLGHES